MRVFQSLLPHRPLLRTQSEVIFDGAKCLTADDARIEAHCEADDVLRVELNDGRVWQVSLVASPVRFQLPRPSELMGPLHFFGRSMAVHLVVVVLLSIVVHERVQIAALMEKLHPGPSLVAELKSASVIAAQAERPEPFSGVGVEAFLRARLAEAVPASAEKMISKAAGLLGRLLKGSVKDDGNALPAVPGSRPGVDTAALVAGVLQQQAAQQPISNRAESRKGGFRFTRTSSRSA